MERDTLTFTIPETTIEVVMHTYLTEREKRAVQTAYMTETENELSKKDYLKVYEKLQDLTLKAVIVSVGGQKDGDAGFSLIDFVLNLPSTQFKALYDKVKEIADGEKKTNN